MFLYQAPERPRKIKTIQGRSAASERADSTMSHLSKGWFPADPDLLHKIRRELAQGIYDADREKLIEQLKQDPALFFHCVKHMRPLVDEVQHAIDPIEQIRKMDVAALQRILPAATSEVSGHHLKDLTRVQALRIQHSVLSATAAETIATQVDIVPEAAFTGSMFRQLGLNLVAWNYPSLYTRAITAQRMQRGTLEDELERLVGINPRQVSMRFAREWNMNAAVQLALSPPRWGASEGSSILTLPGLCQLSELYAQVNDPEHYPKAKEEWRAKEPLIKEVISPQLIEVINQNAGKTLERLGHNAHFIEQAPFYRKVFASVERGPSPAEVAQGNAFVKRCPPELRQKFQEMYGKIDATKLSVAALSSLVDTVVPSAGFVRGCLYFLNEKSFHLTPVLRIGDRPLSFYRPIAYGDQHPASRSAFSQIPMKLEDADVDDRRATLVTGSLGDTKHAAVLYLEVAPEREEDHNHDPMLYFQAIREALIDCLGERNKHS